MYGPSPTGLMIQGFLVEAILVLRRYGAENVAGQPAADREVEGIHNRPVLGGVSGVDACLAPCKADASVVAGQRTIGLQRALAFSDRNW